VRERLRNRAVLLVAILAVALAVLGTYTWSQTAHTRCPTTGVCLVTKTHHVHPLRARIEWAAAVVCVIGAASLAMSGRRSRRRE
jgi:TRAP-type C4-dicarboxylate transport system permease small subunit